MGRLEGICCRNFVSEGGYAFFSNWFYNGFYKVELATGKTTFLGSFKDEKIYEGNIHREIFLANRKIYFCPRKGRHMHVYDLDDYSMCSVDVGKNMEQPLIVREIVVGEHDIYIIPKQETHFIRKINIESLKVTEINRDKKPEGKYLSECKDVFPAPWIMKEYQIELADRFFWKQVSEGIWYGFRPMERQLLKYIEETDRLEIIPLILTNQDTLEEYLSQVKIEMSKQQVILESRVKFQDLLNILKGKNIETNNHYGNSYKAGKYIWKMLVEKV